MVADRAHNSEWWGIKDPRLAYTLPYFDRYIEGLKIVHIQRDFYKSVASLAKRDNLSEEEARKIQSQYQAAIYRQIGGAEKPYPVVDVSFEALLHRPEIVLGGVMHFLTNNPYSSVELMQAASWIDKDKVTV